MIKVEKQDAIVHTTNVALVEGAFGPDRAVMRSATCGLAAWVTSLV
jgi:hypothetical protein